MSIKITVTVNGVKHTDKVEPRLLLVHYLRDVLRLTGTHVGCCTILVNGKATKSCTMLAVQADKAKIMTIEGLASNGELHPLQEGFNQCHGLQCGFCTPGIIMTASDLLKNNKKPSEEEIRVALEGNFCRCTGYVPIVAAIQRAADMMSKETSK